MTTVQRATDDVPSDDELDDILNGILNDDAGDAVNNPTSRPGIGQQAPEAADLGIDEEIKVFKKKQQAPKLDQSRLLSAAGLPRLRRISKERLRFKGKGHEYGDIARMLNMYQLWLDDLFPRAKFADALSMVEKLGHLKRIQMMRKEWIDEGKPRASTEMEHDDEDVPMPDRQAENEDAAELERDTLGANVRGVESAHIDGDQPTAPQLDAHLTREAKVNEPDEDELDALLAEEDEGNDKSLNGATTITVPHRPAPPEEEEFEEDLDAMAEMEGLW